MEEKAAIRQRRNQAFHSALAQLRPKLAVVNAFLLLIALFLAGNRLEWFLAAAVYASLCVTLWLVPALREWTTGVLYFSLLTVDLAVSAAAIALTGGPTSPLLPCLFLSIVAVIVRYKYGGILIWCTVQAIFIVAVAVVTDQLTPTVLITVVYVYLAGVLGGYLVRNTYTAGEEVSNRLARWNRELQRLNVFSKEVAGSSDLSQICNQTLKVIQQNNPAMLAAILIFDENGVLKILEAPEWREEWLARYQRNPLTIRNITLAPILVFKKPLLFPYLNHQPELAKVFQGIPFRSLFAFPLISDGEVIGAVMITSTELRALTEEEVHIMESITNQAGFAIQNAVNLRQEKQKADTDGLTGLYNRRFFNEQIEQLVHEAVQKDLPISLIMIDIDNFKKYNDTYGHPAGDQLLKKVAAVITDAVRDRDIVARYGGEEIVVILRNTENELACIIAERIRSSIEDLPLGVVKTRVTVSLGVGTLPDHARDRISLLEFADKSLYEAKHNGKNQVCCGFSGQAVGEGNRH